MSTADRQQTHTTAATSIASQLREAEFVHLVTAQTGDGVAAAGLLGKALTATNSPYQTSIEGLPGELTRETDADLTVAVGRPAKTADITIGEEIPCTSKAAYDIAAELGTADPMLALAGHRTAGVVPDEQLREGLATANINQRPGVAVPTADPVDGLTHSTLVHASFSGSTERTGELLASIDETAESTEWKNVATALALSLARDGTPRGATAVENLLKPYVGGPFETVGGYGDVLDAVVHEKPGRALALALGSDPRDDDLDRWRTHASKVHDAIRTAETGRYNGLFVAQCDESAPVEPVARLMSQYCAPEPVTLVTSPSEAAAVSRSTVETNVGNALEIATSEVGANAAGTGVRARAHLPAGTESSEVILAFKEAL